jgi:prolactin regulatory element-binding protein
MSKQLVVATTHNLLVYSIKTRSPSPVPTKDKGKGRAKLSGEATQTLELTRTVDLPLNVSTSCTFRSVRFVSSFNVVACRPPPVLRFHPHESDILYTVINTSSPRERGRKTPPRQGYISRWNTRTWTVERHKKVGDKALTAFDTRYLNIVTSFLLC